jgi:2-methylcitrate dehydratase PrpD
MTADSSIFDGADGFIATYGGNVAKMAATPIEPWKILEPGIYVKRWPCCYASHRPLAGIFELMTRHTFDLSDVREVGVGFMPGAATALIHTDPKDGLSAKFSIEYTAAAALLDGKVGLRTFTDDMVRRPTARQLMAHVKRFDMPGEGRHYSGVVGSTDVYIDTSQGRFKTHVASTPGSPTMPMTKTDRRQKFLDCAEETLSRRGADEVLALLENAEALPSLSMLTQALVGAGEIKVA